MLRTFQLEKCKTFSDQQRRQQRIGMIRNALAVFPPSPLLPRKTSKLVKNKTRHWLNKREKGGEGKQTESVQSLQAVKIPPHLSPIPVAFRGHLCILILPPCCNRFKLSHAGTKEPKRLRISGQV